MRIAGSGLVITLVACAAPHAAPSRADDDAAARFDYLLHCSGCHRTDGTGSAPDVPSLRGPVGSLVGTPRAVITSPAYPKSRSRPSTTRISQGS